jgi:hypothetical protein
LLRLTSKQINRFLYAVEGVGAAFVGIFIVVYLAGLSNLPGNVVYHSEPAIRLPMSIVGGVFVALVLVVLLLSVLVKRVRQ